MLREYIYQTSQAEYQNKLLLLDVDGLEDSTQYSEYFANKGFEVVHYTNDLEFRLQYEEQLNSDTCRLAVIAQPDAYIPYDIQKKLKKTEISFHTLYPRLDAATIREKWPSLNHEFVCQAYMASYESYSSRRDTEDFIQHNAYGKENIRQYTHGLLHELLHKVQKAKKACDWFEIANIKANIDVISTEYELGIKTDDINRVFCDWILTEYGKLGTVLDDSSPILVSNALEYIHSKSKKFALIVMDGMAEFDWNVISRSFTSLRYHKSSAFAMIPTVTSVSRQCLLSGKYPYELQDPWHQAKEKSEFFACANSLGYQESQIEYLHKYDASPELTTKCCSIIIMDIDNAVHAQTQGREGMFNTISALNKKKDLLQLSERLIHQGFDVYITADHGNTLCTGIGKLTGTGVETETRSHRMTVMKDFADKTKYLSTFHMFEFPKYYLPKEYDYLICSVGEALDPKGLDVMNHGGISLDEVIVPFITIYSEENNG